MFLTFDNVKPRVLKALAVFYAEDLYLVRAGVHERSLTFRLGIYLQQRFPKWNVDCEYNRNVCETDHIKCIPGKRVIYPDIVIHRRGTAKNLLVIEAKPPCPDHKKANADIKRIEQYITRKTLQYRIGLFLEFKEDLETTCANLKWCIPAEGNFQWLDQRENKIAEPLYEEGGGGEK